MVNFESEWMSLRMNTRNAGYRCEEEEDQEEQDGDVNHGFQPRDEAEDDGLELGYLGEV